MQSRKPLTSRSRIGPAMRRLGQAIEGLQLPAVEKISTEQSGDSFRVLIATMLSAQTRDEVTSMASERLFEVADTPEGLSRISRSRIEKLIYPVSFYRHKARHIVQACRLLLSRFDGQVPTSMEELLLLPGVGRKTANLVLILAYRSETNICVDTHVHRISNRLGWVKTKTPTDTEHELYRVVRRKWWPLINLYMVVWGQNICRPIYPLCNSCEISFVCPRIGVKKIGRSRTARRKT